MTRTRNYGGESPTLKGLGDGPHAAYIATLIDRVRENRADGGATAQVAALAVRGIVTTNRGPEWAVLVEVFGIPTSADWRMAQAAYGPNPQCPGMVTYPYLSRKCQYCGETFTAQRAERDGSTFRSMDSRGRLQTIRTKTVDAMPAYIVRQMHERTCPGRQVAQEANR